jgi:hypothetical protein
MDTAMASYMSELDYLTGPLTNHVLSAEMHNQAVNSLCLISARMTAQALEILTMMLANITLAHVQAIDLRVLQIRVQEQFLKVLDKHKIPTKFLIGDKFHWFKFAFNPRETATEFMNFVEINGDSRKRVVEEMQELMGRLVDDIVKGRCYDEVFAHLGKGEDNDPR